PGGPYKFSGPHKSTIQRTACRPIVRLPVGPTSGEAGARGLALAQRGPEAREARRAFEWRGAPGRASPLSKPWTFRIGAWNPGRPVVTARATVDPGPPRTESPDISGCGPSDTPARIVRMTAKITRINPDDLHETAGYHHITIVEAGRTAYLAGQCPLDPTGALVGPGDLDAQIDQVAANALAALTAVGARPEHVVRSVIYVVSDENPMLTSAWDRLNKSVIAPAFTTASTLLGVARLGYTGQLIEVDLTAALPD